jgi:hypothetical protein
VSDKKCRGSKPDGSPCAATIVQSNGWCPAHDPDREQARKRAAARANLVGRDPELQEIKAGLRRLTEWINQGDADLERVAALNSVARTRLYAARVESEVVRHSREVEELEDYAADLEERYEELKNGHADGSAGRSRARR